MLPSRFRTSVPKRKNFGTDYGREAVKSAVMCEDVARTVLLARTLGELTRLDQADIDALHDRYQNVYGQRDAP